MKIGVRCTGFIEWTGGVDFLSMIAQSLLATDEPGLEVHLFIPDQGALFRAREAVAGIKHAARCLQNMRWTKRRSGPGRNLLVEMMQCSEGRLKLHHIDIGKRALAEACRRHDIDVLLPSTSPLSPEFPVPWVGYVADFQHKYLAHYFSAQQRAERDRSFDAMTMLASCVIVNSRATASDIERFIPSAQARIVSLPFAAAPREEWLNQKTSSTAKYNIPKPYFIISNQFWLHKRHDVAFQAFRALSQKYTEVQLVCTGSLYDSRSPSYVNDLLKYVDESGMGPRIRFLGLIPKLDQIELMKGSVAAVQPTSFEGGPGGGSVYDAVAVGVPTIVSDITVNREIEDVVTAYFPLGDAEALSATMAALLKNPPPRPSVDQLRATGHRRRRACGEALLDAARFAIAAASRT
jgi:glycosyltransferase involved in cell wall biosynthesis